MRFLRALVLWVLLESCVCINDEGRALLKFRERVDLDAFGALLDWDGDAADACLWFGVECSDGKIVSLNLKDLRLEGTLSPELGKLIHIKSLILLNNSFSGIIPKEIGELHKLEVLDLRHNNFSGPLPSELNDIVSLGILVLRGNRFGDSISPELNDISALSELGTGEELISSHKGCKTRNVGNMPTRKLLQVGGEDQVWHHKNQINIFKSHSMPAPALSPSPFAFDLAPSGSPSLSPFPSRAFSPSSPSSAPFLSPSPSIEFPSPIPSSSPIIKPSSPAVKPELHTEPPPNFVLSPEVSNQGKSTEAWIIYMPIIVGVSFLLALSALYMLCCRANNVVTVRPWATGLSGQLQRAFVIGVPALKRPELETACEDFSNIIGSLSDCRLYKGTLSSGVEIAVVSTAITSAKDWSKHSESQFRKKISELSKVNHKNFVNLLGYCAEQEPFTRMLVFEYAPNGTLFEHLHIKEAEDLDWAARMRIAMGIAYCLEHMQQLNPPVILKTLDTSAIYLTDDFASKVGDISFWNNASETLLQSESIVYKFGMLMLEIISGRVPFSEENGNPEPWLSCYLKGTISEKEIIDPALGSFRDEDIKALLEVISSCIRPEIEDRPKMAEVASRLKHITSMTPDRATPSVSPLWWAEIEILSSEAN